MTLPSVTVAWRLRLHDAVLIAVVAVMGFGDYSHRRMLDQVLGLVERQAARTKSSVSLQGRTVDALGDLTDIVQTHIRDEKMSKTHLTGGANAIDQRVKKLEAVLEQTPERALSAVMLRKDLDNLQERYKADVGAIREEFNRTADFNKWFLALLGAIILGSFFARFMKRGTER
jgi:hypothetical protein